MKTVKFLSIGMIILSFIGCNLMYSIKGSGNIIEEKREIADSFGAVKISNHGNLFIEIGDRVELKVKGDDNLVPHIITEVKEGTLVIRSDRKLRRGYRSRKGIKYYLTVQKGQLNKLSATSHGDIEIPELTGETVKLILSSHGDIKIGTLRAKEIKLYLSSHGDLKIKKLEGETITSRQTSHSLVKIGVGKVREQKLELTSHGDYIAKKLISEKCDVLMTSHSKVVVNVSGLLEAELTSHGNLYYLGKPELQISKGRHATVRSID